MNALKDSVWGGGGERGQMNKAYSYLYSILFYSILFYSILFYSILFEGEREGEKHQDHKETSSRLPSTHVLTGDWGPGMYPGWEPNQDPWFAG